MDHDISGEESPGILSDDQPPESPSDAPDIEEGISTRGMPWLRVTRLTQCSRKSIYPFSSRLSSSLSCSWPTHSTTNVRTSTSAILAASADRVEPVFVC